MFPEAHDHLLKRVFMLLKARSRSLREYLVEMVLALDHGLQIHDPVAVLPLSASGLG